MTVKIIAMRLSGLMLVFALSSSFAIAQNEDESKNPDMMNILEPSFKVVNETVGIDEFLLEKLNYPTNAAKIGAEGTVVVQFEVQPDGTLSDLLIVNSVPEFDYAVINAVKASSGMWTPGTKNGQPVAMEKKIAVVFRSEESDMYKTCLMYCAWADKLSKKGNYKRAIKLYNKAIVFCPLSCVLYQRGLAKYYIGDRNGALMDFERSANMGNDLADTMLKKLHV